MSTWVAPSVAAEIWGMSVDHILAGIADGSIQSFVDGQFLFVDVEGRGFPLSTPRPAVIEPIVSPEEIAALTFRPRDPDPEDTEQPSIVIEESEDTSHDLADWRAAREQTGKLRVPPKNWAA
jgi:hypothetical protein